MKKKIKEYLLKIILIILIAYFSLLFIIFIFQRNLLYHPKENNYFGDELKVKIEKVKSGRGDRGRAGKMRGREGEKRAAA